MNMATPKPYLYNDPLPVTLVGGVTATIMHNSGVTNPVLVVAGPVIFYGGYVTNPSTTAMGYLQCFDAATASAVTLGTTPPVEVIHVPPLAAFAEKWATVTVKYVNGLVVAATTDVNNGSVAASGMKISLYYASYTPAMS